MKRILVIGQTPPPYGGQAVMIKKLLDGDYNNVKLFHVRMSFSKEMSDMGKFSFLKIVHLVEIILKALYFRIMHNVNTLYYPPSGPEMLPMLRDLAILCSIRWMFKKTIFHFHAAGISEMYPVIPWYLKFFYHWGYFKPDIAIYLSEFNPNDGKFLKAKNQYLIPNGITDDYSLMNIDKKESSDTPTVLFVGLITETKGILILIDAMKILLDRSIQVKAQIVGKFESSEFEKVIMEKVEEYNLSSSFDFTGVLVGLEKHEAYLNADIFCFPTFFECESFGLVAVEAMQFGVPVVLSRWRGVQSLIDDGAEGFFVPVKDDIALAEKISFLVRKPDLRREMGKKGRERYLAEYHIKSFYQRMDRCFQDI